VSAIAEGKDSLDSRKETEIKGTESREHSSKTERSYGRGLALHCEMVQDIVPGTNTTVSDVTGTNAPAPVCKRGK